LVEELATVVRVKFAHWEGQTRQDMAVSRLHDQIATPQDGHPFTPASGDIQPL
jgi:hypothetical protein